MDLGSGGSRITRAMPGARGKTTPTAVNAPAIRKARKTARSLPIDSANHTMQVNSYVFKHDTFPRADFIVPSLETWRNVPRRLAVSCVTIWTGGAFPEGGCEGPRLRSDRRGRAGSLFRVPGRRSYPHPARSRAGRPGPGPR